MTKELNLKYNREPVCPYCGDILTDAWEMNLRDGESEDVTCGNCDEEFKVTCSIDVTYDTEKKEIV
jgi:uncharacterized Zn-finger protein